MVIITSSFISALTDGGVQTGAGAAAARAWRTRGQPRSRATRVRVRPDGTRAMASGAGGLGTHCRGMNAQAHVHPTPGGRSWLTTGHRTRKRPPRWAAKAAALSGEAVTVLIVMDPVDMPHSHPWPEAWWHEIEDRGAGPAGRGRCPGHSRRAQEGTNDRHLG
jgi:hypothetical protein